MKNISIEFFYILLSFILLTTGCSNDGSTTKDEIVTLESDLARNLKPDVSNGELLTLAENNNKFAFAIFDKIYDNEDGNIFFSPYSISKALVMNFAGARAETKAEMASVFNFDMDNDEQLHRNFNGLDLQLNHDTENYTFSVLNSIWIQKNYPILKSYLDTIKVNYGAKLRTLDYIKETEASRIMINNWVEEQTHELIQDIIPKGAIDELTRVVLVNTVYFKGEWLFPFYETLTNNDTFRLEDGSTQTIPFMRQMDNLRYKYLKGDTFQVIALPYLGSKTSMLIVLPEKGKFVNSINNIEDIYQKTNENMMAENIAILKIPKFEFTTPLYNIKEHLKSLGMNNAFSSSADFGNMTSDNTLRIDSILHKAFIKIDEKGTEATASTVVIDSNVTGSLNPIVFDADRPFIFFIKDNMTHQILFMGVMKEP